MWVDTILHNLYFCSYFIDNRMFLNIFTWNFIKLYLFSNLKIIGITISISKKNDFLALSNCELSLYLHGNYFIFCFHLNRQLKDHLIYCLHLAAEVYKLEDWVLSLGIKIDLFSRLLFRNKNFLLSERSGLELDRNF